MTADPVSLLVQGGLMGVFMIFVILTRRDDSKERAEIRQERLDRDKQWREQMEMQSRVFSESIRLLNDTLHQLADKFDAHDKKVTEGFAILHDRVRPNTSPRKGD